MITVQPKQNALTENSLWLAANPAVYAMQLLQKEMADVRDTKGMETEEAVMHTVKEIRSESH